MSIESDFIDAINADPGNRFLQLVYADWLDELGDPRAEAWRVLIEAGKRPEEFDVGWDWWEKSEAFNGESDLDFDIEINNWWVENHSTFFAAMDAAATAWVRHHHDPEFAPFVGKSLESGMTAAEAEREYDSAPAIPISETEVESLMDEIMGRKPAR